jgi:hypothetical protein
VFGAVIGPPTNSEQALVLEALNAHKFITDHQPRGMIEYYTTLSR